MTNAVTALLFTVLATGGGLDTTLSVPRGTRLEVDNFAGEIQVATWSRDALRIEANYSKRTRVDIDREGRLIRLTAVARTAPRNVDYRLTVPTWMPLDLHGMSAEILVVGSKAAVTAKSINGGVKVRGGTELVTVSSLQGLVEVENVKGRVEASSMNRGVRLRGVSGDVLAESMNGMIVLDRVRAKSLEASTVNGSIVFVGSIVSGGLYSLSTHNGSVIVGLDDKPDVTVSVATFSGGFSSSFPVTLEKGRRGKRFNFTLGSGSAKLELESFQGSVRLARLGEMVQRLSRIESQEASNDDDYDWEDYKSTVKKDANKFKAKDHDHEEDEDKE